MHCAAQKAVTIKSECNCAVGYWINSCRQIIVGACKYHQHCYRQNNSSCSEKKALSLTAAIFCCNGQHRFYGGGMWDRGSCHFILLFCGAAGEQVIHLQAEGSRQGLQKGHIGVTEPPLPFADSLVGHVEFLRQHLLGQFLPLSILGNNCAELRLIQSDHLAYSVAYCPINTTDQQ